jgi:hypothetical protein
MPLAFSQTGTVDEILNGLRDLQKRDDLIEAQARLCGKKATRWGIGLGVCFVLGIISLVLSLLPLFGVVFVVGIACLICMIYWIVQSSRWSAQDMEDRRLALALKFFEVLGRDVPKKAKCAVDINFDGYLQHGQLLEQQGGGWLNPITVKKFADTWFTARGRLSDGNQFRVSIEQVVRRKEKRKRKYTKVNERIVEEVTLALKISPESYPNWQQLAQTLTTGGVDGSLNVTRVQALDGIARIVGEMPMMVSNKGRYGTQTSGENHLATGDTLLRLFLYVYDKLQRCQAEQAASA